jgi:hypothetical protein
MAMLPGTRYVRSAIRKIKRVYPIKHIPKVIKLLHNAGIEIVHKSPLPKGQWIYWLDARVHGMDASLVVCSRTGWVHFYLDRPMRDPNSQVCAHHAGPAEVFLSPKGEIRVHSLDSLGFIINPPPVWEGPQDIYDAPWLKLVEAALVFKEEP